MVRCRRRSVRPDRLLAPFIPTPVAVTKPIAQLSAVGVPAGAVLDTQELIDEPSFYERGILQTMVHGERKMAMPT
jgi:crotonobetainyl-CoA:carnitine CoA-transferase CaiB-like acyl-CoA transferase